MSRTGGRVVFAGPSIHGLPSRATEGLDLRPPARRDDIAQAVEAGAQAILLIDGLFGDGPTVSHKEIVAALRRGVPVAGAASLGALRAAECAPFGMVGIGRIVRDYAEGRRTADSDVALLHAPAGLDYLPLTLPLVDAEATLGRLAAEDLSPGAVATLRQAARDLHFSQRTWERVAAALPGPERPAALAVLHRCHVSLKSRDARLALGWFRRQVATPGATGRIAGTGRITLRSRRP